MLFADDRRSPKQPLASTRELGAETHKIDYWEGSNKDGIPHAMKALQNKPNLTFTASTSYRMTQKELKVEQARPD
jgi:hypothetical protein